MNYRAPSVPLVTVDPYLSIWSNTDNLYDDYTKHWTGAKNSMTGLVMIDGDCWRFMGRQFLNANYCYSHNEAPGMKQTKVEIDALTTTYEFEAAGISLEVKFMTPLLLDDLDLMSRPVSYIQVKVKSIDGNKHDVKVYFDITGECCVDSIDQEVIWDKDTSSTIADIVYMGTKEQNVLGRFGDNLRIDWGYLYLAVPKSESATTCITSIKGRDSFRNNGTIEIDEYDVQPRAVEKNLPLMATTKSFDALGDEEQSFLITVAYDDISSIEYFEKHLKAYWKRNGLSIQEAIDAAINEYSSLSQKADDFNKKLLADAEKTGGEKYAAMLALAYRQAIVAHKLVEDEDKNPLFISKECFSNGCMATVDVSYPSIPIFLLFNPELVKGMMVPVFKFAASKYWDYDFAPHDIGTYPRGNGQTYGLKGFNYKDYDPSKGYELDRQMPVEECGNMIIMATAYSLAVGNADYAKENWDTLTGWLKYLLEYGQDPGEQLCTDDFAGHLSHNTNLSVKGIMGIGAYSILCKMLGYDEDSKKYHDKAKEMATLWEKMARDNDHYKLTFTEDDTWSLKYNMVWDSIFGLNIFDSEIKKKEIAYYKKMQNEYGAPLDSRRQYTKTDWLVWAATMADDKEDFEYLVNPIMKYLNDTPCRTPFTDWYGTIDRMQRNFQHRSVLGGIFIKLLSEKGMQL